MKLKRLELHGFKSFRDRTVIHFGQGSTGIVGPNGCGKSNVVDAFFWVMGEMSPKHLRGQSMDDVIFAGTTHFPPASHAEVSLWVEREEPGKIPGEFVSVDTCITRRLDRNGESTYLINNEQARLKDIHEILMDTGVGNRSYSIIEQGAISRLVTSKPEERRSIIEEAAGIVKFKVRKKETFRKIEQTEANLQRLSDIIIELEERKKTLERQAEKARKAKQIKEDLRVLDFDLYAQKYFRFKKQADSSSADLTELQKEFAEVVNELARLQAQSADQGVVLVEEERSLEAARVSTVEIANERNSETSARDIRIHKLESLEHRIEELDRQIHQATGSMDRLREEADLAQTELNSLTQSDEKRLEDLEAVRKKSEILKQNLTKKEQELVELRRKALDVSHRKNGAESEYRSCETKIIEIGARLEPMERGLEEQAQEKVSLNEQFQALNAEVIKVGDALRALEAERSDIEEKLGNTKSQFEILEREEKSFDQEIIQLEAKERSISSMIDSRSFSDFADILKEHPEWRLLEENIPIASEYDQAVRAALSGYGLLLASRPAVGEEPTTRFSWAAGTSREVQAGSLASFLDESASSDLKNILADVIVVDQISETGPVFQVTKSGEFFTRGIRTSGAFQTPSCLSLQVERDDLKKQIEEKKVALGHHQAKVLEVETLLLSLQTQFDVRKEMITEHAARLKAEESQLKQIQRSLENMESVIQKNTQEKANLQTTLEGLKVKRSQITFDSLMEELAGLQAKALEVEAAVQEIRRESSDVQNEYQEMRLKEAARDERIRNLKSQSERIERELREQAHRQQMAEENIEQSREQVETLKEELESGQSRLEEIVAKERVLLEAYQKFRDKVFQLRTQSEELRVATVDLSTRERELTAKVHQKDKLLEQARAELVGAEEYMHQRYEFAVHEFQEPEDVWSEDHLNEQATESVKMRERLNRLGDVNWAAVEEYDQVAARYTFLQNEKSDLNRSIDQLKEAIHRIEDTTAERFRLTFEHINEKFQRVFPIIFGGGNARLVLTPPVGESNEHGVDIVAQPPGKKMTNINLMSGGEKAMTAISLIFAMFLIKPSPFCLLDEVDAPLDDTNIGRFNELVKELAQKSQFVVITHNKRTMEFQDMLYGVTMQQPGISRMVSVQLQ